MVWKEVCGVGFWMWYILIVGWMSGTRGGIGVGLRLGAWNDVIVSMVCGILSIIHGLWLGFMVYGLWFRVYGL